MADALFDRALELVMDAGQTLLENGGEVFRAQQTMEIMAASLGVRDFHVYVLTNGIFASAHLPGRDAVSLVRHVPTVSVHLGRVEAVNELSRELAAGRLGVVEAEARLNTARTLPRSTPQLEILACVVGAAGFAYLFGGTLADMPVAAVAGLLEALVCQQFARHGINRIFTDIVAAFCGTIWAIAVQTVVPAVNANAAIIGALMVLTYGIELAYSVPDDIWICGFDDSQEASYFSPRLTSIHIHGQIMGYAAANLLMTRIEEPSLNYRTVYTETNLILRESTGD